MMPRAQDNGSIAEPGHNPLNNAKTAIKAAIATLPFRHQCPNDCTTSSVTFFASPNSIIVFGRKNNSLSTPA